MHRLHPTHRLPQLLKRRRLLPMPRLLQMHKRLLPMPRLLLMGTISQYHVAIAGNLPTYTRARAVLLATYHCGWRAVFAPGGP